MGKLLSVKEYAELKGAHPDSIRRFCISGRLPAIKVGKIWCIDEDTPYLSKRHSTKTYISKKYRGKIPLEEIIQIYHEHF